MVERLVPVLGPGPVLVDTHNHQVDHWQQGNQAVEVDMLDTHSGVVVVDIPEVEGADMKVELVVVVDKPEHRLVVGVVDLDNLFAVVVELVIMLQQMRLLISPFS